MFFKATVILLTGMLLGSLAPNLITASYDNAYDNAPSQQVLIPKETWARLCARVGNWTYAQFSHEWWAEHGGYGPSGVAWELAWGQIYYEQIKDLKAMGC